MPNSIYIVQKRSDNNKIITILGEPFCLIDRVKWKTQLLTVRLSLLWFMASGDGSGKRGRFLLAVIFRGFCFSWIADFSKQFSD